MLPKYCFINYVFQNLTEQDPFLQFVIDMFCVNDAIKRCSDTFGNANDIRQVPQEAFARIFLKLHEIKGMTKEEKKLKRCEYKV